jgi:hypothetical protein
MGQTTFTNCGVWMDGYNLSGDLNQTALNYASEAQDATTFGNDTKINRRGLLTVAFEMSGFVNAAAGQSDTIIFPRVGSDSVFLVAPGGGAVGERAFGFKAHSGSYSPGGQVGAMLAFDYSADGAGGQPPIRGTVVHNATRTATGEGTGYELGAVTADQKVYALLQVTAASASDSLTVTVESDADNTFGSPTTRFTFTAATAVGAQILAPVSGAITDTWWRVTYTITGTDPSFSFIALVGIQ